MGKKLVVLFLALAMMLSAPAVLAAGTRTVVKLPATMEALNVRSGPSLDTEVSAWVKDGYEIDVLSVGSKWSKIKVILTGKTGYINNGYIKELPKADSSSESLPKTGTAKAARVSAKSVNLRKGPGTGFGVARSLSSGTKLKVWGDRGNWSYVSTLGGTSGWISKTYLKDGFASKTDARVNMRESANGALIKTLEKGASVSVLSMTGNWSKVKSGKTTGYVFTKYLK